MVVVVDVVEVVDVDAVVVSVVGHAVVMAVVVVGASVVVVTGTSTSTRALVIDSKSCADIIETGTAPISLQNAIAAINETWNRSIWISFSLVSIKKSTFCVKMTYSFVPYCLREVKNKKKRYK